VSFTLASLVRDRAAEQPNDPVLTYQGRTITFAELDQRSNRVANALSGAGVGAQERLAFLDRNTPEFFEALFGGAKINAVSVAVNWRLAAPEILYTLNDAKARVLIVGEEFLPQLEEIEDRLQSVEKIVVLGSHPKHESYEEWVGAADASDPGIASAPDDVAFQLYTSGTTGLPKGAMLSNANFEATLNGLSDELGFRRDAVNMVVMPLFHIAGGGWALAGMVVGAHSIMHRDVDPGLILEDIPKYGVTLTLFVPAVIQFLLMHPACATTDFSTLETIVYGASPISAEVLQNAIETFQCKFVQAYGLTETSGGIVMLRPEDHDLSRPHLLRSCGKPYDWVELRIVDAETGGDAAPGRVGEIWTRSAHNMKGYWGMPEATADTITSDGWLKTGDAGYMDEDGYLYLHDRVKDMVVSGGENVYPAEIENVLMAHPDIADVAVIGVPDEKWGEAVKAIVVRTDGSQVTEADIIEFARGQLAGYKCPKSIDFTSEPLPRNPSGKLLKRVLREPYWAGVERRIH
jgi:long-chain acyl-CoA synthetase